MLADGTKLGLSRMADASRGLTYHHLVNVAQWHVSENNYVAGSATIINAHQKLPLSSLWDDGATSSSDGQYFRAGGRAAGGGAVTAKYGIDPGFVIYTHVSGRYDPFYTKVIAATVSEAPYLLDGLMHHAHQTDLKIAEHYTDTAGATDHVFGLCHVLGFRFAPRIKDLKDRKLYAVERASTYPPLEPLIGEPVDTGAITTQRAELVHLKVSIVAGSARRPSSCASSPPPALAMRSRGRSAPSGGSNARGSPYNGCPTPACGSVATPG